MHLDGEGHHGSKVFCPRTKCIVPARTRTRYSVNYLATSPPYSLYRKIKPCLSSNPTPCIFSLFSFQESCCAHVFGVLPRITTTPITEQAPLAKTHWKTKWWLSWMKGLSEERTGAWNAIVSLCPLSVAQTGKRTDQCAMLSTVEGLMSRI